MNENDRENLKDVVAAVVDSQENMEIHHNKDIRSAPAIRLYLEDFFKRNERFCFVHSNDVFNLTTACGDETKAKETQEKAMRAFLKDLDDATLAECGLCRISRIN